MERNNAYAYAYVYVYQAFLAELSEIVGRKIAFSGGSSAPAVGVAPAAASSIEAAPVAGTVEHLQADVHQAQHTFGYKTGVFVTETTVVEARACNISKHTAQSAELLRQHMGRNCGSKTMTVGALLPE